MIYSEKIEFSSRSLLSVIILAICLPWYGCGGGGGSSDDVRFQGTVTRSLTTPTSTDTNSSTTTTLPLRPCPTSGQGIKICAFESCSTSSSLGEWGFTVSNFGGGDVDLFLEGCGVDAVVRLPDLNANTLQVDVDLQVLSRTRVTFSNLVQYGDPDDESPDDDILSSDSDDGITDQEIDEAEEEE